MAWKLAPDIAERIRELREAAGWSQTQFGAILSRHEDSISNWERGTTKPPIGVLERLCQRFGWPVAIFAKGGPRPGDVIRAPIDAGKALGMNDEPQWAPFPSVIEKGDITLQQTYLLAGADALEWTAMSANWRGPAQRALRWFDELRTAALREWSAREAARDDAERALRAELAVLQARLDEAEQKLHRAGPRQAAGGKD